MKKHGMFVRIVAIKYSGAPNAAISAKFLLIAIRTDTKKIKTSNSHNKLVSKLLGLARGQGVVRFKSGASKSWLEATPTEINRRWYFPRLIPKQFVGAASCREFRAF
jgi:hypothetical protein